MSQYPAYVVPSTAGMTFASGPSSPQQQLPAGYLCSEADAQRIQHVTGGTLVNAATEPSLGMTFAGVEPSNPNQPYYVKDIPAAGFVGPAVAIMWGLNPVNGGGVGNPGSWTGVGSNPRWVPTPPPPPPLVPPASTAGDPAALAAAMGVVDASDTATRIKHIEAILVRQFGA